MVRQSAKIFLLLIAVLFSSCSDAPTISNPRTILWAWERPEDLRFVDRPDIDVAFLAQTLQLSGDDVVFIPRRQPLEFAPGTHVIAVTRIETARDPAKRATLSVEQIRKVVARLKASAELPNVKELQIDFDATVSEREFYKSVVVMTREMLPANGPISITALASWCMGDRWMAELPIEEAVPMLFDIGPDDATVREFVAAGNDWREPKCRSSYGLSVESPRISGLKKDRKVYFFKSSAWRATDIPNLKSFYEN